MFGGNDLVEMTADDLREVRGNQISMIFQDPLSSLHPFYKVGKQLVEAIQVHRDVEQRRRDGARGRAARAGRDPRPRAARRGVPARVLGRDAPAGDDRDGAHQRPAAADRRRADDGARRDHAGSDPEAARAPAPGVRDGDDHDHPRSRRGRRGRRPRAGDVRRAGGRVGDPRADLLRPPAPLHLGAARLADPDRQAAHGAAGADRRPATVADLAPRGLSLPRPLPARVQPLHAAPAARAARRASRATPTAAGSPPEQKQTLRVVSTGEIGLEAPAA